MLALLSKFGRQAWPSHLEDAAEGHGDDAGTSLALSTLVDTEAAVATTRLLLQLCLCSVTPKAPATT